MGSMTMLRATEGRLTRADRDAVPENGLRHELLDGAIVMTPSPGVPHQRASTRLFLMLHAVVQEPFELFIAPFDVVLPTGDVLIPDLSIGRQSDLTDKDLTGVPVLVVEILSPSTRRRDLGDKLTAYRDAGVPHYWVVDPSVPRLIAHDLVDGGYAVVADVSGDKPWTAPAPVDVTVVPADLVR